MWEASSPLDPSRTRCRRPTESTFSTKTTLQDLPDRPRFVINATNVQSGALWRFSKPYMADYKVGMIRNPRVPLAGAVAASSAFPPFLSPFRLEFEASSYDPEVSGDLHDEPFTTDVVLTDGGVYDNLGLETAWKRYRPTILVSDGGGLMAPEPEPKGDWARHAYRINSLIDHQVRNLRKRQVLAGFQSGDRTGTYWGIRSHVADYKVGNALPCQPDLTVQLAQTRTRLKRMDAMLQERLINWGYAICDAAMRKWVVPSGETSPPASFPYPGAGIG